MSFDNRPLAGGVNRGGFRLDVEQFDLAKSVLGTVYTLAQSGVAVPLTGTTVETTLAQVTIPGGLVGSNGSIRVSARVSANNNANSKSLLLRFGGAYFSAYSAINVVGAVLRGEIWARGAINAQAGHDTSLGLGASSGGLRVFALDMSQPQTLSLTGTLAVGTDTLTLESYTVEVFPSY